MYEDVGGCDAHSVFYEEAELYELFYLCVFIERKFFKKRFVQICRWTVRAVLL